MNVPIWQTQFSDSPLVATAIHDGDAIRAELQPLLAISPADRLREQDPFTGMWTSIAPTRIVGLRSRFEVDLNRPREGSVYLAPEDAWGLNVWNTPPDSEQIERSLFAYDAFYEAVRHLLTTLVDRHGRVVVFDLHTYNHRRDGADGPVADPNENPEVNLGTASIDRARWAPIVDCFADRLRSFNYYGRHLDVRENVKFKGGNFPRWIHENFPESVCAIAIEFKKFFMDEWTGQPEQDQLFAIGQALQYASEGVLEELEHFERTTAIN